MSALVPSLLTLWRQRKGQLSADLLRRARPSLMKTAIVAAVLAVSFTVVVLASIHLMLSHLIGSNVGPEATLVLSGAQGALAALVVTPLALVVLFRVNWT